MKFEPRIISLVLAFAGNATLSWAASTTFSDGIFSDADWSAAVVSEVGPPVSFTAQQVATGGNPAEYRQVQHSYGGPGSIVSGHLQDAAIYDPASQGAISSLDFSFDIMLLNGGDSLTVAYGALLYQNGSYYGGGGLLTTITPTTNVWVSHTFSGLDSAAFSRLSGPAGATPDFSASGGAIQLGYFASNGTSGGPTATLSGLDNWSMSVTPVPEPASALLLLIGLLAYGVLRRSHGPTRSSGRRS